MICIDDFGVRALPVRQLIESEASSVRLSRSIVDATAGGGGVMGERLSKGHVQIAHSLFFAVAVPWVESNAQAEYFRRLRCQTLQGPHLSGAMPYRELLRLLYRSYANHSSSISAGLTDTGRSGPG